jgi:hypothetical protein
MLRKPKPRASHESSLPDRRGNPWRAWTDADRRGFLRQLAGGSGALCLGGLSRLAGADELPVDFSVLERHRPVGALVPADAEAAPAEAEEADDARAEAEVDRDQVVDPADEQDQASTQEVVENRALWVEPGYLILMQWQRPVDDTRPVDAIPAATEVARSYLASRVTSVDQIHNIDQLHVIEAELVPLLAAALAPAEIAVLHLDHDCRTVCSALDPSRSYPEPSEVDGEMPGPEWE